MLWGGHWITNISFQLYQISAFSFGTKDLVISWTKINTCTFFSKFVFVFPITFNDFQDFYWSFVLKTVCKCMYISVVLCGWELAESLEHSFNFFICELQKVVVKSLCSGMWPRVLKSLLVWPWQVTQSSFVKLK